MPSQPPDAVTVNPLNATSATVSWSPPPPEHQNGIIQSYTIRVEGVHTQEDFDLSTNSTEVVVGNLRPFYSYRFIVAAITISHGPYSAPITVAMPSQGQ